MRISHLLLGTFLHMRNKNCNNNEYYNEDIETKKKKKKTHQVTFHENFSISGPSPTSSALFCIRLEKFSDIKHLQLFIKMLR